ncbi:MAG: hypothetical protein H7Y20_15275 [Bryobacteraceae bacterium]|nr:hypothetical protein [Bryobacteraceae bacterium]
MLIMRLPIIVAVLPLMATACLAETRFFVDERIDYAAGKSFGTAGVYELITTKVITDAGAGKAEVLKPRDPAHGNGIFVLDVNGKQKTAPQAPLLDSGVTIIRLTWPDSATLPAGVQEITSFLKYKGGPMLLGDQRRFLKKAVVIDNASWLGEFVKTGKNTDEKGRQLFDLALRGASAQSLDPSKAEPLTK